jgi:hypothetical protein
LREKKNCISDFCEWTFSSLRKRGKEVLESLNEAKKAAKDACKTCKIPGIFADLQLSQFPKKKCLKEKFMTISHKSFVHEDIQLLKSVWRKIDPKRSKK